MSKEIDDIFNHLENEVALINYKYSVFKTIFEESREQIELLNRIAPVSFRFFQDALIDDIILSLNRLLDPETMRGEENLSLMKLNTLIEKEAPDLFEKINPMISELTEKYSCIRIHRHKRLVHNDIKSIITDFTKLPPLRRKLVVDAIDEIGNILREVSVYFYRQDILFDLTPQAVRDAGILINCLEDGTKS